ncbi:hypothetical protein amrb99_30820 [Actinomadura sp. RB99]|uniref:hypothetical protein n=1 Tax=Actinomadura sp. RB99 TaxID=2691577 RepID=UPI001689355C|nr:hypothetical protein [Actinomadura sp. RB99]MBD2894159.1 hypothetical protein [Actinomadura sp. RB99]
MVYEVATFQALREQLRCKEVWVVGADRWRNPDADLPTDLESRRVEHYGELRKPLDAGVFIDELRAEMTGELAALDEVVGELEWVEIAERNAGAIKFTVPVGSAHAWREPVANSAWRGRRSECGVSAGAGRAFP